MSATMQVLVDGSRTASEGHDRVAAALDLSAATVSRSAVRVLDDAAGPRDDPYDLRRHVPMMDTDAVVLVAPRRRGPRRLAPGPVVDGRPVALVQADAPADLARPSLAPDPAAPWVVAAMAKDVFLEPTEHWATTLQAGGHDVVDLRADRARRTDLLTGLAAGPRVVLYAGHGRARGWAGYQALRFHHLVGGDDESTTGPVDHDATPRRAVGLVVAFACGTLGRAHSQWPFGVRLVEAGLVRAYLGPASSVRTADAHALADIVVDLLAREHPATVIDLVTGVDRAVAGDSAARRAWQTFRLVGAPDTEIA